MDKNQDSRFAWIVRVKAFRGTCIGNIVLFGSTTTHSPLQGEAAFGEDVIIKTDHDGRLDSAVLACADIDLYSSKAKSARLRASMRIRNGLQAIPEKSVRHSLSKCKMT